MGQDDQTGVAWKKSSVAWDGDRDNIKNKRKVLKKAERGRRDSPGVPQARGRLAQAAPGDPRGKERG